MALDIEGSQAQLFDRHMPIRPSLVDGARFRRSVQQKSRGLTGRAGGAHISSLDPEADLADLPEDVRKKIEAERKGVKVGRSGRGNVHIFNVKDANGKERTIIDL